MGFLLTVHVFYFGEKWISCPAPHGIGFCTVILETQAAVCKQHWTPRELTFVTLTACWVRTKDSLSKKYLRSLFACQNFSLDPHGLLEAGHTSSSRCMWNLPSVCSRRRWRLWSAAKNTLLLLFFFFGRWICEGWVGEGTHMGRWLDLFVLAL